MDGGWEDLGEVVPMESIGPVYHRLAKHEKFGSAFRQGKSRWMRLETA